MPNYIALDWEQDQLFGIEADVNSGAVRLKRAFNLKWPDDVGTDPSARGQWLGTQLQEHRISASQALVTLPREDAVVRHLELPPCPADELSELVRFQAAIKSTRPIDELLLDYLPVEIADDEVAQSVLMTTVAREQSDSIRQTLESAGLTLASIGLTPVAAAELVVRVEEQQRLDETETSLVVWAHGDRVEISVIKRRSLLFTHSTRLTSTEDTSQHIQTILAEVSRSFVALQKLLPDVSIARGWIIAPNEEAETLAARLQERLSISTVSIPEISVRTIDPLNLSGSATVPIDVPGSHAPYVGPAGILMWASGGRAEFVDFLNPRRPAEVKDTRKLRAIVIAASVAVIIGGGLFWRQSEVAALEKAYLDAKSEQSSLEELQERAAGNVENVTAVQEWVDNRVDWLAKSHDLFNDMNGTERYYLTDLRMTLAGGSGAGNITGNGESKTYGEVITLYQDLGEHPERVVNTHEIPRGKDAEYPFRFELDINLQKPEPIEEPARDDAEDTKTETEEE
ncbi:MAG: hypothetical protein CMJ78_06830 [Planctomycetaceae bacterium]|nr:hypothetical protein [Planctomycetaceae bacterium]